MPDDYYVSQYSGEEIDALLGGAGAGTVRYDAAQSLTDAQKQQLQQAGHPAVQLPAADGHLRLRHVLMLQQGYFHGITLLLQLQGQYTRLRPPPQGPGARPALPGPQDAENMGRSAKILRTAEVIRRIFCLRITAWAHPGPQALREPLGPGWHRTAF